MTEKLLVSECVSFGKVAKKGAEENAAIEKKAISTYFNNK